METAWNSHCEGNIDKFKTGRHDINWNDLEKTVNPIKACKHLSWYLLDIFLSIYDQSFPKTKVTVKHKIDQNCWISKGIKNLQKKNKDFMQSY